jgi:hypothetical protein
VKLEDITPQRKNLNRHTQRGLDLLEKSIQARGWIGAITAAADGEVFDGSARRQKLEDIGIEDAIFIRSDGTKPIVLIREDIPNADDPRAKMLAVEANRIAQLDFDPDPVVLVDLAGELDLSGLYTQGELSPVLENVGTDLLLEDTQEDEDDVEAPDILFPSDNDWGVPTLDLKLQARSLVLPCERWGRGSRSAPMPGTYHFYTDDYKFQALWSDPTNIVFSGCRAIIEPNVSTGATMPPAVALWGIYRKRWLARWAQSYGVSIFVDLNVDPKFEQLNLLGVPKGWKAWATRGYDTMADLLDRDYQTACTHAGTEDITFVVVGGGQGTHERCKARGWVHVPQENHVVEGREYTNG